MITYVTLSSGVLKRMWSSSVEFNLDVDEAEKIQKYINKMFENAKKVAEVLSEHGFTSEEVFDFITVCMAVNARMYTSSWEIFTKLLKAFFTIQDWM